MEKAFLFYVLSCVICGTHTNMLYRNFWVILKSELKGIQYVGCFLRASVLCLMLLQEMHTTDLTQTSPSKDLKLS